MQREQVVVRSDDTRRAELEAAGWVVSSRSWAAQLTASRIDVDALSTMVQRGRRHGDIREIGDADLTSVLALDSATLADYPGGVANRHSALTMSTARVTGARRGFGVFDDEGRVVAVTFVDIDGRRAETDFTVVAAGSRGLGIGSAVKAASVLALLRDGIEIFRTGGAAENVAILASNMSLGYVVDEEWVTLSPPLQVAETGRARR
ncbi:acetyltransferase [Leifsonia sp. TF02-11]|uniref:acetyltransferase n=1 Tax=Leifsonia sp. TF02-11 TaxID=2815212 RepID=UPI001AA1037F|nr:acetyltransferase [Leifsonia sp. TF02-11]MBO1738591.1 acetyltransferase [Leifsonia sp. TF02-11]